MAGACTRSPSILLCRYQGVYRVGETTWEARMEEGERLKAAANAGAQQQAEEAKSEALTSAAAAAAAAAATVAPAASAVSTDVGARQTNISSGDLKELTTPPGLADAKPASAAKPPSASSGTQSPCQVTQDALYPEEHPAVGQASMASNAATGHQNLSTDTASTTARCSNGHLGCSRDTSPCPKCLGEGLG